MLPQNNIFKDFRQLRLLLEDGAVITAFDTETTGLHPDTGNVIEIGAVKFDIDGVLDSYDILINPGCRISADVTAINHISDEMVASCPLIKNILPDFMQFVGSSILIAHNANFDLDFVNSELLRSNMSPIKNKTVDTLEMARWAYPRLGKYSLQFLAKTFSIDVKNAHRADDDARVCMNLFLKCLKDTDSLQKRN